jgi:CHAD domain-containing protein
MDPRCTKPAESGLPSVPDEALATVAQSQNLSPSLGAVQFSHCTVLDETGMKRPSGLVDANEMSPSSERHPVTAGAWFDQALRERWELYRERLDACRAETSEEAVHELRVAIRRLLSQFVLLGCVIPDRQPQKARRILKRQIQSLGALRDTTVQRVFIEKQQAKFPELSVLRRQLGRRERRLTKIASGQINHFKTNKLEKWVRGIIEHLTRDSRRAPRRDRMTALAMRRAEEAFAETVALRQMIDFSDSLTIHRTRIAFKKFRYSVECLPAELTGLSKRGLRKLAYYQRRMGNIQDIEVIEASVTEFIRQNEGVEGLMAPFCAYLRRRRGSALRAFRTSADRLFSFWPPPGLSAIHQCPSFKSLDSAREGRPHPRM